MINIPQSKVVDQVRKSKYKNIFAKGYSPNLFEEVFMIKKVENTVSWTYVKKTSTVKKLSEHFNTSNLAAKLDLSFLKAGVETINLDNLKTLPANLSKVNNVVDNYVVKKTLLLRTQYITDKSGL